MQETGSVETADTTISCLTPVSLPSFALMGGEQGRAVMCSDGIRHGYTNPLLQDA